MRLLWLLGLLGCLLAPQGAWALAQHPPVSSFCPYGAGGANGLPDGCGQSPIVTMGATAYFQQPNAFQSGGYFNTVAGTTANYMNTNCGASGTAPCRIQQNMPCVDFACGPYTPIASLLDPATNPIAGCLFNSGSGGGSSGTGGNLYTCAGSTADPTNVFAGVVQHLNLGPVGGHGCTALLVNTPTSGATKLLIDDIYWFNDTGLCATDTVNNSMLSVPGSFTGGTILINYYFDGNASVWDNNYGGCAAPTKCNPTVAFAIDFAHPQTIIYGAIRNFAGRPINGPVGTNAAIYFQYNWLETWDVRAPNGHSEWFNGSTGTLGNRNTTIDHDVVVQGQNISPFGPSGVFWANNWPMPIDVFNLTNNTFVNSFVGGRPKNGVTISGCQGAPPTGGTATAPLCGVVSGNGNTFYVTSPTTTGALGYGADLNGQLSGGSVPIQNVGTGYNVSTTGTLTWTGANCAPNPVLDVTTNSSGQISAATIVSGACSSWPSSSASTYSIGGGLTTGSGAEFNYSAALMTYKEIAGSYPISNGAAPSTYDEYMTDGFNANQYGPNNFSQASQYINVVVNPQIANIGIVSGHGPTPFGVSTIAGNYIDETSQGGAPNSQSIYEMLGVQSGFSGSISGTALTTATSQSFIVGEFINGTGVTGCATNILGCPTIASGSGTAWTLNTSGGSVSLEAMDAVQLAWCTTPTSFSGNVDMAALVSDANMNQWSVLGLEVGC